MLKNKKSNFRINSPFKSGSKNLASILITFCGFFFLGLGLLTIAIVFADDERVEEDSDLTYYLSVKYDGVDKTGVESNDAVIADVRSGIITVEDTIPDGLIFQSFVTTQDGTIGSVQRTDTSKACGGLVIDDTNEESAADGKWNADETEYTYHGLHYDARSRKVTFRVENLIAGCKLEVGINTRTPILTSAPSRMDFYNTAFGVEDNLFISSNTVHNYIMNGAIESLYEVTYRYDGEIPSDSPILPPKSSYVENSKVNIAPDPILEGYIFSGWQTSDAAILNNSFTMPQKNVELIGVWTKDDPLKYKVSYVVEGESPKYFVAPQEKKYNVGSTVILDDTEKDSEIAEYIFHGWNIDESNDVEVIGNLFMMPSEDVVITGSFTKRSHNVCYEFYGKVIPDGIVPPSCSTHFVGDEVSVQKIDKVLGYNFSGWSVPETFIMPDEDVLIDGEWIVVDDLFSPVIEKTIVNNDVPFRRDDVVKMKVTVHNTANYEINQVVLQEKLTGSTFTDGEGYIIGNDGLATILAIPALGSIDVYAQYKIVESEERLYTSETELISASADDDSELDTTKQYLASVEFKANKDDPVPTGIISSIFPYILLIFVASSVVFAFRLSSGSQRPAVIIASLVLMSIPVIGNIINSVLAANYTEVIESVELTSQKTNFKNSEPGAWRIEKKAEWIDEEKAKISLNLETIAKNSEGKNYDIILAVDRSYSMAGKRMNRVKSDAIEFAESVLSNTNNRISLVEISESIAGWDWLSNDRDKVISDIEKLSAHNFIYDQDFLLYDGLSYIDGKLTGYEKEENRELYLLILSDGNGMRKGQHNKSIYDIMKTKHPELTIASIYYGGDWKEDWGDFKWSYFPSRLREVSDTQYVSLFYEDNNVLFDATFSRDQYDDFVIEEYLEDDFWTMENIDNISVSSGEFSISEDSGRQKIVWNIPNLSSGKRAKLTMDISLKDEFKDNGDTFYNTSNHTTVVSKLHGIPDENISSNVTPILKNIAKVTYESNSPSTCTVSGMPNPTESYHKTTTILQISDIVPKCEGYIFKGWNLIFGDVDKINNDTYIIKNGSDIVIKATWGKLSIEKSVVGEVYESAEVAFLTTGSAIKNILWELAGPNYNGPGSYSFDRNIVSIRRAKQLPEDFVPGTENTISTDDSPYPIYVWSEIAIDDEYNDVENASIVYIYSPAKTLKANANMSDTFYGEQLNNLRDIDALSTWDTSEVTTIYDMFQDTVSLKNIDALRGWDVSNVVDMRHTFGNSGIENVDALSDWDVSNVVDMGYMFSGAPLKNIDGLRKWDVSNVNDMAGLFSGTSIENVDALSEWDISNVTRIDSMFSNTPLRNINGLSKWDTSNVSYAPYTFSSTSLLSDFSPISGWNMSKVTNMSHMFSLHEKNMDSRNISVLAGWNTSSLKYLEGVFKNNPITSSDIEAISEWDTSNVRSLNEAFYNTNLVNLDALSKWNVTSVKTMSGTFAETSALKNIDGLSAWNTISLESSSYMFNESAIEDVDALANWNVSKLYNTHRMFENAKELSNINGLSSWDLNTRNNAGQRDVSYMFAGTAITSIPDLNWNYIYNAQGMFSGATQLSNIDGIAKMDITWNMNFSEMFKDTNISNLDALSSWVFIGGGPYNITTVNKMFYGAKNLTDISGASGWYMDYISDISEMFAETSVVDASTIENWGQKFKGIVPKMTNVFPSTTTIFPSWYKR